MQTVLTEKELGHALFYSIKRDDFDHAQFLLALGALINTSFFIDHQKLLYTPNLLVGKVAETITKYGTPHAKSQQLLRLLDLFIEKKCDLRCHCTGKNPHYCPISQCLKYLKMDPDNDLLVEENLVLLKLLYNGATYQNLENSKEYVWSALKQLNSYLQSKKSQTIELIKMNRHSKVCNRHTKCANLGLISITDI